MPKIDFFSFCFSKNSKSWPFSGWREAMYIRFLDVYIFISIYGCTSKSAEMASFCSFCEVPATNSPKSPRSFCQLLLFGGFAKAAKAKLKGRSPDDFGHPAFASFCKRTPRTNASFWLFPP
jgi:hypothetical protein